MTKEDDLTARIEEWESIRQASRLSARLVYEVIRRDGEEELNRPTSSLVWSGVAGGVVISFSVLVMSIFQSYLPDAKWRPMIESFGYSFGFLLVILGRLQLFTENTITTVIPLYTGFSLSKLRQVTRLWIIVFLANLVGAAIAAHFLSFSGAIAEPVQAAILDISLHLIQFTQIEILVKGIPAGILIAALVWILPSVKSPLFAIIVITYVISLGKFTHVVAGSVEVAYLVAENQITLWHAVWGIILPSFVGNVIGGTAVFTLMAWGQVRKEHYKKS
ncbi:formate/nitrite transporter family protein [Flexibacterium corallicola]|uniref:formate/nitrite transporter family protein n=1 Tax=Flexibacterium corallicola TaxID=3037259 RepID=UPI00286F1D25|nr:formate/nitrite transporter family protein [Pseudovibrio sp. M1P-2-3]